MAITGKGKNELISWGFRKNRYGKSVYNRLSVKSNFSDTNKAEQTIWRNWFFTSGGYALVVTGDSYALSTSAATLKANRVLSVVNTTYSFTTQNAAIGKAYRLTVTNGVYSLTTQPASLLALRKLPSINSSYVFTTQSAGVAFNRILQVLGDPYNLTPQDANFYRNRIISVDGVTYTLTNENALLIANRLLSTIEASYLLNTQDSSILINRVLSVLNAVYSFNPQSVNLVYQSGGYELQFDGLGYSFSVPVSSLLIGRKINYEFVYALTVSGSLKVFRNLSPLPEPKNLRLATMQGLRSHPITGGANRSKSINPNIWR